jgi:hypothetical protein
MEEDVRDEIVKIVQERIVEMAPMIAQQVADAAIAELKAKLPPALAPLVDGHGVDLSALEGMLGGLFGPRSG